MPYNKCNTQQNPFVKESKEIHSFHKKPLTLSKPPNCTTTPVVTDRFIPFATSKKAYRTYTRNKNYNDDTTDLYMEQSPSPDRLSSPEFFTDLRTTGNYQAISSSSMDNNDTIDTSLDSISNETRKVNKNKKRRKVPTGNEKYQTFISNSLGFPGTNKVFNFISPTANLNIFKLNNNNKKGQNDPSLKPSFEYLDPLLMVPSMTPNETRYLIATSNVTMADKAKPFQRASRTVQCHSPYKVLDAPSLRNDFYSNLISWSNRTNNVLVALGCSVYLWSESFGALQILNQKFLNDRNKDLVTCVSFDSTNSSSNIYDSTYFLVGTKNGSLLLFDQFISLNFLLDNNFNKKKSNDDNTEDKRLLKPISQFDSTASSCFCCIQWISNSKFLVGDDSGSITFFKINNTNIEFLNKFKAQNQQVCGMLYCSFFLFFSLLVFFTNFYNLFLLLGISINSNNSLLAVGGNDNSCTLWNIENIYKPEFKFILPHLAAVKAVTFCPWSSSLLATGGGSKDRKIKFWHTKTGILLNEFKTCGQVTSLIWSKSKKQIVATFGFNDTENPTLLKVYSYPKMIEILQVKSPAPLRVLTAVLSPSSTSICIAANDETIRFYKLWSEKDDLIKQLNETGVYGSDIIEYLEGIVSNASTSNNKVIR
ncbi:Ama1p NDAI_0D02490 [Naumovozyma dairenensis CBS 421]|uniref:Uncharacterized protein n=1 Tax=Naumovozyma dairenensis (strain ATCC 10597 / BCRC 20456 / CBS 421 / NBRC 0211 / NRRL Y-12639) TaxID=1071378 RepID=G0W9V2_NAUDC|nr:hypothetical protein NDAI_0D02490 [Naumovozyma dairenensis CBS 421]CCD24563.1 hypothetical protein NDAI_0D02490 [Naumovozyma dairenensis CBS 421]